MVKTFAIYESYPNLKVAAFIIGCNLQQDDLWTVTIKMATCLLLLSVSPVGRFRTSPRILFSVIRMLRIMKLISDGLL